MIDFLLATILYINQIDFDESVLYQSSYNQNRIIEHFNKNNQKVFRAVRTVPPIKKSDFSMLTDIVSAKSAAVVDITSGQILWQKNTDSVLPIASLTKLMTAIIFFEDELDFETEIVIEEGDYDKVPASKFYLLPGEKVTVGDIFYTSLVGSGNNATSALARSTGISREDFLSKMNQKAKMLGVKNTNFNDVTGLDTENKSTVLEYGQIASYAFQNLKITEALRMTEYSFQTIDKKRHLRVYNTNKMIGHTDLNIIGAKTGYIDEAGFTFVCQAEENGHEILIILFDSDSSQARFSEAEMLVKWSFSNFEWL